MDASGIEFPHTDRIRCDRRYLAWLIGGEPDANDPGIDHCRFRRRINGGMVSGIRSRLSRCEGKGSPANRPGSPATRREPVAGTNVSGCWGDDQSYRLLGVLQDDSIGLRYEERDIYFRTLELAIKTPLELQERFMSRFRQERLLANLEQARRQADIDPASLPDNSLERGRLKLATVVAQKPSQFPAFLDLWHYPDENRGRPVSLHGILRKLTRFDPGENKRGVGDLYEGWIYCDDCFGTPTVVVFADKPEHLQVGGDLAEEVQVTGYFLKMYAYQGQEAMTKSPLVLAGGLLWHPRPAPYSAQPIPPEMYLLTFLAVVVFGYSFWQSNLREMTSTFRPRLEPSFSGFPPRLLPVYYESTAERELRLAELNDS